MLPGESLYSQFLTPDADVIDDTLVYRRAWDKYLVVVNASNDDKDRTWFESVRDGKVKIDNARPFARTYGYDAIIRNLRDPKAGSDMRVDIALQGPKSRDILLAMGVDDKTKARIMNLKRTELCDGVVGGFDLIVSRTGYTGEKMAFELFVHPDRAVDFWNAILKAGEPFGVKPIGLGARDSLRTEAGLPLYGHEMGLGSGKFDERDLGVAEGGFGSYVKTYKPYFIGRDAYLARERERKGVVVRFRFDEQSVRMAHNGDPVVNAKGERIGWVTSCAVDAEDLNRSGVFGFEVCGGRNYAWNPSRRRDGSSCHNGEGGEQVPEVVTADKTDETTRFLSSHLLSSMSLRANGVSVAISSNDQLVVR